MMLQTGDNQSLPPGTYACNGDKAPIRCVCANDCFSVAMAAAGTGSTFLAFDLSGSFINIRCYAHR